MTIMEKNAKAWKKLSTEDKINLYDREAELSYKEYELVEDNFEYDNGLTLIVYEDVDHEIEIEHFSFNLDSLDDYLNFI